MKIRSQKAALAEAVRRWGKTAVVKRGTCFLWEQEKMWDRKTPLQGPPRPCCYDHPRPCPGGRPSFRVGRIELGLFFMVKGTGSTWDEAFANADDPAK